jgi:proteic killer suppression protein
VTIRSFKDGRLEEILQRRVPKGFPADLVRVTQRKLVMMDAATELRDLASPPGNRLEALGGDRAGQHSIRINDQFRWTPEGPSDVELTDYH